MRRVFLIHFSVVLLTACQAEGGSIIRLIEDTGIAETFKPAKKAALPDINPPLKDVASDKKFFGPPFPADYPDDKRPTVSPSIAWQLKSENKPYPYLQSRREFDRDYVKDENSDKGDWRAQFDYDAYRRKLAKEEDDVRRAREKADKEGHDVSDAEKAARDAEREERDAKQNADDAKAAEDAAGKEESDCGEKDKDRGIIIEEEKAKLEILRKKVAAATAKYEKEKKEFEECDRKLRRAQQRVYARKEQLADYEEHMASRAKLWAEKVESMQKAKQAKQKAKQIEKNAAALKVKDAQAKLQVANNHKAEMDQLMAKEQADLDIAMKNVQRHASQTEQARRTLEAARLHLRKLRGYTEPAAPSRSSALGARSANSVLLLVLAFAAAHHV